jgi:hypothetical protein
MANAPNASRLAGWSVMHKTSVWTAAKSAFFCKTRAASGMTVPHNSSCFSVVAGMAS